MVRNNESNPSEGSNAAPETGHANSTEGQVPPWFGPFGRRGHGAQHVFPGPGHPPVFPPHFHHHPEVVSLEPGPGGHPGHPHPAFHWRGPPAQHGAPDPPLPEFPDPPVPMFHPHPPPPPPPFPEIFNLVGEGLRNVAGEFAANFIPPPGPHGGPPRGRGWRMGRGGGRGRHARHWHGPHGHHEHREHREWIHPSMDIYSSEDAYIVTVELPGLKKEDVDISVNDGLLVISGEITTTPTDGGMDEFVDLTDDDEKDDATISERGNHKAGFVIRERQFGKFKRSITLPPWVNVDGISATMVNGLLKLVFEKPQNEMRGSAPHKVPIF